MTKKRKRDSDPNPRGRSSSFADYSTKNDEANNYQEPYPTKSSHTNLVSSSSSSSSYQHQYQSLRNISSSSVLSSLSLSNNDDDDDDEKDSEKENDGDKQPTPVRPDHTTTTTLLSTATSEPSESKRERRARAKALKKQKRLAHLHVPTGVTTIVTPSVASAHPFQAEPRDHAETPFEAYADIEPLLFKMAQCLGKTKETVILYDPYYCEGSMRTHLNKLGFRNVINENKDFYHVIDTNTVPHHDILVTNPPFSSDHMERILNFCIRNRRPYFLLLPQFVAKKGYYLEQYKTLPSGLSSSLSSSSSSSASSTGKTKPFTPCQPIYLGPTTKAYSFTAPQRDHTGTDSLMKDTAVPTNQRLPFQIFSGSFQCIWFIFLGLEYQADIVKWWRKKYDNIARCKIDENDVMNLPQLMAVPPPTPAKRRWRKKISRLHKQMSKQNGEGGGGRSNTENTKSLTAFVPGLHNRPGSHRGKKE